MRIFISHSWRDKTTADRLASDLSGLAEVWLDTRRLTPGDEIQPTIDAALRDADIVLLLWSAHAAASKAVGAEIETCLAIGRAMLPCLLDDTPLPRHLAGTLGIVFRDGYNAGFSRLNVVLLERFAGSSGVDVAGELDAIRDAEGVLRYLQDYRARTGRQAGDTGERDWWIERVTAAMQRVNERGAALQQRLRTAGDFVQQIYADLEQAGDDAGRVRNVLARVISHEHIAPDLMRQVRGHIESYLATLPTSGRRGAAVPAGTPPHGSASPRPAWAGESMTTRADLRRKLAGRLPPQHESRAIELLSAYVEDARPVLEVLERLAAQSASAAASEVVRQLNAYLASPDDLVPESEHGAWGLLDDAWLIHNVAYRIVEAGLAPESAFGVDWQTLIAGDALVRSALPATMIARLESIMVQLLQLLADEFRSYSPRMARRGGYRPHMPGGSGDQALDVAWEALNNQLGAISLAGWSAALESD